MTFPWGVIFGPIIRKLTALQSFFFDRPRLDVDLVLDDEHIRGTYGQRGLGPSSVQEYPEPLNFGQLKYDYEFYWNYKIKIKNNSSKSAYGIMVEKITIIPANYETREALGKIDALASLKEGELMEVDYSVSYRVEMKTGETQSFLTEFPNHIEKIEIVVSYNNEARKKYFTKFLIQKDWEKTNEHLLREPKLD